MLLGVPPASFLTNHSKIWAKYGTNVDFSGAEIKRAQILTRFTNLEEDFSLAGPTSGTPKHRAHKAHHEALLNGKHSMKSRSLVYTQQ